MSSTLWLFNIAMEAMAHRNRWFSKLETSIYGWDFPVRYVSHNQMVWNIDISCEIYREANISRGPSSKSGSPGLTHLTFLEFPQLNAAHLGITKSQIVRRIYV